MTGGILGSIAWLKGAGDSWLVVAGLLFAIVAFTLIRITPVYTQLLDPALMPESPEASALLEHWGRLHRVRSILSLAAFAVALAALLAMDQRELR